MAWRRVLALVCLLLAAPAGAQQLGYPVPRFDFEAHRDALTGTDRQWPESTRAVSQIRIAIRYRPGGSSRRIGQASAS